MDTEHTTADQMQVAPVVTDSTTGPVNGDIEKNGESSTAANSSASLEESLLQRVTTIKEGDNVLLRLPSDMVKAVVASQNGLVQLGKFGSFPARHLLGRHYDITYEIYLSPHATIPDAGSSGAGAAASFGQGKGKGKKKKSSAGDEGGGGGGRGAGVQSNPGWKNALRPLRRQPLIDAVVDDIKETNEFIDDTEISQSDLLSHEEINALREQGVSAEELIQRQMERHERFELKTEFSKEKWRQRKEKKYRQTIHAIAPTAHNIINHQASRSPQSILYLREDTLSQLLVLANVRPGGRYLVIDDTGGLVTAAMMERMGCRGRIMTFTENDSPPAWGVLGTMNFSEQQLECVKWLSWMEADEDYQRPAPPAEDDMPAMATGKRIQRLRKFQAQAAELNAVRDELHLGGWDGIVLATELSPQSVLARLTPYLLGSAQVVVYSPYQQILAELLSATKKDNHYLNPALTESWSRTYQVLPGRTHPLMTTSATGGYLFYATKVFPSEFMPESNSNWRNRRQKKPSAKASESKDASASANASDDEIEEALESGDVPMDN